MIFLLTHGPESEDKIKVFDHNLTVAGEQHEVQWQFINKSPLAAALNNGLTHFYLHRDVDAIGFLANDIEEPAGWLDIKANHLEAFPSVGVVSIYPYHQTIPHGMDLIGNYLIRRELFEKIGFFTEQFGEYGPLDLDYCQRARIAGYKTEYITGVTAEHKEFNHDTVYGFSKKEKVNEVWDQHYKDVVDYHNGRKPIRIIYPEYLINMKQMDDGES